MNRDEYRYFRGVESYLLRILWLASGQRRPRVTVVVPAKPAEAPAPVAEGEQPAPVRKVTVPGRALGIILSAIGRTLMLGTLLGSVLAFTVLSRGPAERFEPWLPSLYASGVAMGCLTVLLAIRQALKERRDG